MPMTGSREAKLSVLVLAEGATRSASGAPFSLPGAAPPFARCAGFAAASALPFRFSNSLFTTPFAGDAKKAISAAVPRTP